MRILIYGLSKSGTTILAAMLKSSLEKHLGTGVQDVFEPHQLVEEGGKYHYIDATGASIAESAPAEVVKTLIDAGISPEQVLEHAGRFDKKIFIVRDPRDRLLSGMFYRWHASHNPDPERFERAYRLTQHKESHPRDLPTMLLWNQNPANFPQISKRMANTCGGVIDFLDSADDDWCVVKYEDLIDGKLDALEEYLGIPVLKKASVSKNRSRVVRTKSYGNWRVWFTEEDVNFLRPAFKRYMQYLGYDYADWQLESCDSLPCEQGSEYMLRMYLAGENAERRKSEGPSLLRKLGAARRKLRSGLPHISRYELRPFLRPAKKDEVQLLGRKTVDGEDSPTLIADGLFLERGWYMAEVLIESDQSYLDASFHLIRSGGRKPLQLRLPARSGRVAKRLIWCARGGEQLLFTPANCHCGYEIQKLTLVRVSALFARDRMKARLARRQLTVPRQLTDRWVRYDATFSPNGARVSYQEWIKNIEPRLLRRRRGLVPEGRQFSLIMPICSEDSADSVRQAVDSIRRQEWKSWRLSLILSNSLEAEFCAEIERGISGDTRIQVVGEGAWESIVSGRTGEYQLLCSPRAVLAPQALPCLHNAVQQQPGGKVFYVDEDLLGESGRRTSPRFKSAWNPDLLFSQNYIGEIVLFAPGVLNSAGELLLEREAAWDLSLILGASRNLSDPDAEIVHVPRVLFHRIRERDADSYLRSSERILRDHFARLNHGPVQVSFPESTNTLRVSWPVPEKEPLVSLLIPTRDKLTILRQCVDSILKKTSYRNFEILVLDNQSQEPETLEYFVQLETLPNVRILPYDAPFNYSAINNFGASHARGDIIGLINNDVEVISPDWLTEMVGHAVRSDVGCVGAKLYYGDGRIQHAGVVAGLGGMAGHVHKFHKRDASGYMNRLVSTQCFSAVTAACLLVRKAVFESVGGLNEKDLKVAFNDVDLCLKVMKAGYRNIWTPWAELYHHESISRGIDNTREKRARFDREAKYLKDVWLKNFGLDPYYSPFLTHSREDFSLGLNEKREAPLTR